MGFLYTLASFVSLFLRKGDYVEESEKWFDDVWKKMPLDYNGIETIKELWK